MPSYDVAVVSPQDGVTVCGVTQLIDDQLGTGHVTPGRLTEMLTCPNYRLWAVHGENGAVIGCGGASISTGADVADLQQRLTTAGFADVVAEYTTIGMFHTLATAPHMRGRGIGSAITGKRLEWLDRAGVPLTFATAWVHSGTTSMPVLEAAGFVEHGRLARYWRDVHDEASPCVLCGSVCECAAAIFTRCAPARRRAYPGYFADQ